MARYEKYTKLDWKDIQNRYDSGISWKYLGLTNACLAWGKKNKYFRTRPRGETVSMNYKSGKIDLSPWRTKSFRKKMSNIGGVRHNAGRCKSITYLSPIAGKVRLNGTWEYKYALWLDEQGIRWIRNIKAFWYKFGCKIRKYYPDFYLIESDEYTEVKGYETEKDRAKWSQFPEKLTILKKSNLISSPYNLSF